GRSGVGRPLPEILILNCNREVSSADVQVMAPAAASTWGVRQPAGGRKTNSCSEVRSTVRVTWPRSGISLIFVLSRKGSAASAPVQLLPSASQSVKADRNPTITGEFMRPEKG